MKNLRLLEIKSHTNMTDQLYQKIMTIIDYKYKEKSIFVAYVQWNSPSLRG